MLLQTSTCSYPALNDATTYLAISALILTAITAVTLLIRENIVFSMVRRPSYRYYLIYGLNTITFTTVANVVGIILLVTAGSVVLPPEVNGCVSLF